MKDDQMSSRWRYQVVANDNPIVRITMRHDRITVAVIGGNAGQPRQAALFRAHEAASARTHARVVAAEWLPPTRIITRELHSARGVATTAANPAPSGSVVVRG